MSTARVCDGDIPKELFVSDDKGREYRYVLAPLIDVQKVYADLQRFTRQYGVPHSIEVSELIRDNIWRYFSHSGGPLPGNRIPRYRGGVHIGYSGKYVVGWLNLDGDIRLRVDVVDIPDGQYRFVRSERTARTYWLN